ncbi:GIY-YIG nuclease family protein [Nostoc sp. KVJ3]|uniref:GIY-YIG nuclease family protein n=1 Tax=Nostoc sp. KVJ3 TaxID=457945 RepID=UPI002238EC3E|nr:GIY-YIG nuclease family protein [Nostoc sp. KVJ3]
MVVDASDCVWYVGQATNIKARWAGKTHHRYPQLIRSNKKRSYRIYWQKLAVDLLTEKEKYYIQLLQPELNACKVKKYLPKQPQVEREIKRLLKVLNNPTFLFPVVRSVVAGRYEDNGGIHCIVILININDTSILFQSMKKRHSPQVKNAWGLYRSYCGKNKEIYQSSSVIAYSFFNYRFEFIEVANIILYLEEHSSIREQYVGVTELLGVQVKAFKYLDVFNELPIEDEYIFTNSEGKKCLTNLDYLKYRHRDIKCLQQNA